MINQIISYYYFVFDVFFNEPKTFISDVSTTEGF